MPVRVEMTMGMDGNMKMAMSGFVFNADMDNSLFSVEPPAGYTVDHQKTDTSPDEEKDLIEMFRQYSQFIGDFPESLELTAVSTAFWTKAQFYRQWQRVATGQGAANKKLRHKYEELLERLVEKPNGGAEAQDRE